MSPDHYGNVVLQPSGPITVQLAGGGGEQINLIGRSYQANEKSSGSTFHMNPATSAHIKEQRRHELHFVATVSEAGPRVLAHSSPLWLIRLLHSFSQDKRSRAPAAK